MKITLHNYEEYLLDWSEGNLNEETLAELRKFLSDNPQIKTDFDQSSNIKIIPTNITFNDKSELYHFKFEKTKITHNNFNEFCIALYENLLSEKKRDELLKFSKSSIQLKNELTSFRKVYLEANSDITFKYKNLLYKKTIPTKRTTVSIWRLITISAAASVVYVLLNIFESKPNQIIATNKTKFHEKIIINVPEKKLTIQTKIDPVKNEVKKIIKTKNTESYNWEKENIAILKPIEISRINTQKREIINNIEENKIEFVKIEENVKNNDLLTWNSILSYTEKGIQKVNKIMGSDIQLSHNEDASGKIKNIRFKTGIFEYYNQNNR
jgi:hypothetical protein